MSRVEQATYEVLRSEGSIEIRRYPSMIVAEVVVEGGRATAISRGFRRIAGYIFGANAGARKIAMTAPVMQQRGSIAGQTSPSWLVRFGMPSEWTMEALPRPTDANLSLRSLPTETYAVITFPGFHFTWSLERQTRVLEQFMARERLDGDGPPVMAFLIRPGRSRPVAATKS